MGRRILQVILAVVGIIAIVTGILGIATGILDDFYSVPKVAKNTVLDSNLRYFSGLWFGLGLLLLWIIPSIERQVVLLRALSLMIFCGAIGRIFSMTVLGLPSIPFLVFTLMELAFPLLLLLQQSLSPKTD
jgi:hypothetical protein